MSIQILCPKANSNSSAYRGGGRFLDMLKENIPEAEWIDNPEKISPSSHVLVPYWNPFEKLPLEKKIPQRQSLVIFDAIPQKYPSHFPSGLRGGVQLWMNKKKFDIFDNIITISEYSKEMISLYLGIPIVKIRVVQITTVSSVYSALSPNSDLSTSSTPSTISSSTLCAPSLLSVSAGISTSSTATSSSTASQHPPKKYAIYVGDVNWNKNLPTLAEAIKLADVPCYFVGKPFNREYIRKNVEYNDNPWLTDFKIFLSHIKNDRRFIFKGYVPHAELFHLYKNAVCNILVSRDEGFGLSYLEASTQKTPSILSDIPIFHETAGNTRNALFADHDNPADIAENIKRLFTDNAFRDRLGKRAYERSTFFSPEAFRKSVLKALE